MSVEEGSAVVKTGDEGAAEGSHPLQFGWTLWYNGPAGNRSTFSASQWDSTQQRVLDFSTVEKFWSLFNNVLPCSRLPDRADYYLFKKDLRPSWDYEENANGGRFLVRVKNPTFDEGWLNLVLAVIGDQFTDSDEITGIVATSRAKGPRIALWVRDAENTSALNRLGEEMKKYSDLRGSKFEFFPHPTSKAFERSGKRPTIVID